MNTDSTNQRRASVGGGCYEFAQYRLDTRKRALSATGEVTLTIAITPKAMDLLITFVTHAGELLEKNTLLDELWPNSAVYELTLSQHVFMLRRILGEGFIKTVPRRGFRFVATVRAVS